MINKIAIFKIKTRSDRASIRMRQVGVLSFPDIYSAWFFALPLIFQKYALNIIYLDHWIFFGTPLNFAPEASTSLTSPHSQPCTQRMGSNNGIKLLNSNIGCLKTMEPVSLKILTESIFPPNAPYQPRLWIKCEGELKIFLDIQCLKITCPPIYLFSWNYWRMCSLKLGSQERRWEIQDTGERRKGNSSDNG